jgi:FkbM family methyltransferase
MLVKKYKMDIRGIIHVGAHAAEEKLVYDEIGAPVLWIDGNKDLCRRIAKKIKSPNRLKCAVIADDYKDVVWYSTTRTASDSILKPEKNLKDVKDLRITGMALVQAFPLSHFQGSENFLNLDIQGAELLALQGADISRFDYVYTEVHEVETYKGCAKVWEIDKILCDFSRVETKMIKKRGWGDALYVRQ